MKPILEMKHVTKRFPGVLALDNVSFSLKQGEFLGICGENGAGKSTLMKILSGSYPYGSYEGELHIDGKPVKMDSISTAQALGIEMAYQELNVMLDATVAENLMVGNLPGGKYIVDFKKLYNMTREFLDKVSVDLDPAQILRSVTNSGQIQLISILRAIIKKPRILVLDEPTTALTGNEVKQVFAILEQLRKEGVSILYISHKLDEVFELCDSVLVLRDGKSVAFHLINEVSQNQLIEEMVGRNLENQYRHKNVSTDEVVLSVKKLHIPNPNISTKNIIDELSFEVHRGEVFGLGGLVGAGRSEVLGAIFGQLTNGVKKIIEIEGQEIQITKPADAVAAGLAFLTEERRSSGLVINMNIRENISLASLKKLKGYPAINERKETKETGRFYEKLRIKAPSQETRVGNLSGGNQQKVVLAKWLMTECKVLFLDEPTKGIDVGAKREFYDIIDELTQKGMAVVLVSSDMPEFISLCDRCIVLADGKAQAELAGDEITQVNIIKEVV